MNIIKIITSFRKSDKLWPSGWLILQNNQRMYPRIRPSFLKRTQKVRVSSLNPQDEENTPSGLRGRDGRTAESFLLQCLLALPAAPYWSHATITRALIHEVTDSPNFSSTWYKGAGFEQRAVLYLFTPSLNRFLDLQTYNERELGFIPSRVWWKWFPFESLGTAAPSTESCVWFIPPLSHISCCIVNAAWVREEERERCETRQERGRLVERDMRERERHVEGKLKGKKGK